MGGGVLGGGGGGGVPCVHLCRFDTRFAELISRTEQLILDDSWRITRGALGSRIGLLFLSSQNFAQPQDGSP